MTTKDFLSAQEEDELIKEIWIDNSSIREALNKAYTLWYDYAYNCI